MADEPRPVHALNRFDMTRTWAIFTRIASMGRTATCGICSTGSTISGRS